VKKHNCHDQELHDVLLWTVKPQIEAVADTLKAGTLRVAIVSGDILDALLFSGCQHILSQLEEQNSSCPPDEHPSSPAVAIQFFDFMDLSNVADYVSLPTVVQAALPLLRVVGHA
jgi:hypothetical protein